MRIGLNEMVKFIRQNYEGAGHLETFIESCGIADLITTCFGGRNRKCAEAFVKTGKTWEQLEEEMLGGQKLQGTLTAVEVFRVLERTGHQKDYPLFATIYRIMNREIEPRALVDLYIRH
jgi:glycerol-3-phosphate dehydrogenase (NAD+)